MTATSESETSRRESGEWKSGGRTVLFAALGYGAGPVLFLTTASVFVRPTMQATGWSSSEVLVAPLVIICITLLGPYVGRLVDKHGFRRAITIGLLPYIALLTAFAVLPLNRVTFYALAVGIGIFGAFAYQIPYNRAVASWFDKGAGKAFGIVGVGAASMPLAGIPLVTLAIYQIGWQAGYLVLAAFALLLALPAAFFGVQERRRPDTRYIAPASNRPDQNSELPRLQDAAVRRVLRTPRFWIFSLHIFFVGGAAAAFLSNMQPILLDGGLSVALATTVTTLFTAGIIFGRLAAGVLMDMIDRYWVASFIFSVSMLGALALANIEIVPVAVISVAAFLTAAGQGAEGDIGAYFILKEYGRDNFGTLYATAGVLGGVGALVMPYVFAHIRDVSGSYTAATYLGALLYAAGLLAILLFGALARAGADRS